MGLPKNSVTLTAEQIGQLNSKLSDMRHDVNNCLSLIIAAIELIRRKPDMAARMVDTISQQPEKITTQIRAYSDYFEKTYDITRD
jgi:hypothetical protein